MSTALNPDVTRWAHLIEQEALRAGLDPREITPLALGIISKESQGKPSARNAGSNTIGLGQQLAYVDNAPFRAKTAPFTHPRGVIGGFKVSWDPHDQIRALVGLLAHYLKGGSRADGDLDSAWLGYASGPGAASMFVKGDPKTPPYVTKHVETYAPELAKRTTAYSAWYAGWARSGRPLTTATVASGEGTRFTVTVAKHEVPLGSPLDSPFDGNFQWGGTKRRGGPVGEDGADPDSLPQGAASASSSRTPILLAFGTLLGAALGWGILTRATEA